MSQGVACLREWQVSCVPGVPRDCRALSPGGRQRQGLKADTREGAEAPPPALTPAKSPRGGEGGEGSPRARQTGAARPRRKRGGATTPQAKNGMSAAPRPPNPVLVRG